MVFFRAFQNKKVQLFCDGRGAALFLIDFILLLTNIVN